MVDDRGKEYNTHGRGVHAVSVVVKLEEKRK
jgi:hypothetical protein